MRNFTCDCGTTRLPATSKCSLRVNAETREKGDVHSEKPSATNSYNQNFRNRFCGCGELYDAHTEKGTMFQCIGLGTAADGGCGEDWWHPECIVGLPRDWYKAAENGSLNGKSLQPHVETDQTTTSQADTEGTRDTNSEQQNTQTGTNDASIEHDEEQLNAEHPTPPGFPDEDDFEHLLCYKCIEAFPWIKRYANSQGFLSLDVTGTNTSETKVAETKPVDIAIHSTAKDENSSEVATSLKRKAEDNEEDSSSVTKRIKSDGELATKESTASTCKYNILPLAPAQRISLFLKEDFREHLCHCPQCFPLLKPHPQLLDEEDVYEPPISEDGSEDGGGTGSVGSRSLFDRGEAALSNMDRVRAIEGVMAYNKLRDNLKDFLKPFADSGQAVGAEDIKRHFEKLRGDDEAIKQARRERSERENDNDTNGNDRKEQGGY